jgi:anti-anti-sigma factor
MQSVSVSTERQGTLVVVLRGEIDFTNSTGVVEIIRDAVGRDRPEVIRMDMAEVTFLDSSGVGVLVHAMKLADKARAAYRVEHPNHKVYDQLRIAGLLEVFGLSETTPGQDNLPGHGEAARAP